MAEYDLTQTIVPYLDRHLVFPLLAHLVDNELFPAEQARIVALLVERVEIGTGSLNLRLRMDGLARLAREMATDIGEAA